MLLRCDRQGIDTATETPTSIEIALTPTSEGTNVRADFSDRSAEDAAFYPQLWERHLDQIATILAGAVETVIDEGTSKTSSESNDTVLRK